jgi:hypothetical protein
VASGPAAVRAQGAQCVVPAGIEVPQAAQATSGKGARRARVGGATGSLGCMMGREGSPLRERDLRPIPCATSAMAPAAGRRLARADVTCGIG